MILIHDLGRMRPTKTSKQKKRFGIIECPVCSEQSRSEIPRALKPKMCVKCFRAQRALPPINTDGLGMKVIQDLGRSYPTEISKQKTRFAIFECSACGKHHKMGVNDVKNNGTTYCLECSYAITGKSKRTHGDSGRTSSAYASLYRRWTHMKGRCTNKSDKSYHNYGGRGIIICDEWIDSYETFKAWAIANGYNEKLTIDREDNEKGYNPENCRWVTMTIQSCNRSKGRNKTYSSMYKGVDKTGPSKYQARIMVNRVSISLGTFRSEVQAAMAYNVYVLKNNLPHALNRI